MQSHLTPLKDALTTLNETQKAHFHQHDIIELLHARSDCYDRLLTELWTRYFADDENLTLVAVGGYGRREMFPLSDLDLLILCQTPPDEATHQQLNAFLNLLWDAKFTLGASIRTLEECLDEGKNTLSIATNMLESRFLAGNEALFVTLKNRLFAGDFWPIEEFYQAKIDEQQTRYARYHNTSYNLEPDLKHSPGGLRDLHLLGWIFLRHYRTQDWVQLLKQGVLFEAEWQALMRARDTLFRMRFALHFQLKRYDNRLRFDRQLQLSDFLGYQGEGNAPVEAMMRTFFQATHQISLLCDLLLKHFAETVLKPPRHIEKAEPWQGFLRHNDRLYLQNADDFTRQPARILRLFLLLTQNPELHASAELFRQLRLALSQLDAPLSTLELARRDFIALFSEPCFVRRAIVPMHNLGVLDAYLPRWQGITGLMQFDLFHLYTVDEHTVQVMLNLEALDQQEKQADHPLCSQLMPQLAQKNWLYLAALFHDIAKGREGDHAEVGALDVLDFAAQHQLSAEATECIRWLVASHLTMSITAQRRDIHDPNVVQQFAQQVQNVPQLMMLTCLTVADICATNPTLWNDWKRSLLNQLYQFTHAQLAQNHASPPQHQAEQLRQRALSLLPDAQHEAVLTCWQHYPEDYFIRNSAEQLAWHAPHLAALAPEQLLALLRTHAGVTELFLALPDQANLFSRIAHFLSRKKIRILNAQLITTENDKVLDSFVLAAMNGRPLDSARQQQIQRELIAYLSQSDNAPMKPINTCSHSTFNVPTRVRFLPDPYPNQSALEIFTLDREGLLALISRCFCEQNLSILNAKITTNGEQAEDFFILTTPEKRALSDDEKAMLRGALIRLLG